MQAMNLPKTLELDPRSVASISSPQSTQSQSDEATQRGSTTSPTQVDQIYLC
jgi:hypothetical protein